MTDIAWTAGPWLTAATDDSLIVSGRTKIATTYEVEGDAWGAANARLIAAAPDLYEALVGLLDYDEQDEDCAPTPGHIAARDAARAALAKAVSQ